MSKNFKNLFEKLPLTSQEKVKKNVKILVDELTTTEMQNSTLEDLEKKDKKSGD